MHISPVGVESARRDEGQVLDLRRLSEVIEHAAHLLPAQGPITVFIHHNTLHAFEDLPFSEAVKKGATTFGCHPYLTEDRYREELGRGRIRFSELQEVLVRDLGTRAGEPVPCFGTLVELRLAMLQYPLRFGPTEELIWYVSGTNALRRVRQEASSAVRGRLIAETRRWVMRDLRGRAEADADDSKERRVTAGLSELLGRFGESRMENWSDEDWEGFTLQALWRVCCDGVRGLPSYTTPPPPAVRHRDLLVGAAGVDADGLVHEILIRFCGAFLDQGLAAWQLPGRDEGFYRAFLRLHRRRGGSPARWLRGLEREVTRLERDRLDPLESIAESLAILGVPEPEWEGFLSATLLALRGWGGMVRQVEIRGDRTVHPIPAGSLVEFLAVRLILDRFALADLARDALGFMGPLGEFRDEARSRIVSHQPPSGEQRAFQVFQLAQVVGLSPDLLHRLNPGEWGRLIEAIETFGGLERRRVFHLAYERRFSTQTLDAIAIHARKNQGRPVGPRFQVTCCLDEREESFRRHLEEIAPSVETFGAAGFYNMAMYYRGAADAHFVPLCPVVVTPRHWVTEVVDDGRDESRRWRTKTRRAIGNVSRDFHQGSRTFALGAILTGSVGVLASFPLVGRILFPRLTARIRELFARFVRPPSVTRLRLERTEDPPGPEGGHVGYSVEEMTGIGERLLRDVGLTTGFARIVIFLGHGSNSQNNPHNSAYHCGACGGSAGGPNARAIADVLNDPRVRDGLAARGLVVPTDTVVVGGYHNTCNDSVSFHDLDLIPASHRDEFEEARKLLDATCERNAHERCRRFLSAPLTLSPADARAHVEERSEDLSQTRPELGHATNAITIVGRREWTRGLYLDRRAFLTSYDPTSDDSERSILTRSLQAVFPVCSGINLEYYFSNIDNVGFGAGTKLPHNLAALLGVMDGAESDLRTGLPWQMVEIHEPMRSIFLIETTPEAMTRIIDRNDGIGRLCRNGWVLLHLIDPDSLEISVYRDGEFRPYEPRSTVLPKAASSVDWYRGWRDHLEFAEIERRTPGTGRDRGPTHAG